MIYKAKAHFGKRVEESTPTEFLGICLWDAQTMIAKGARPVTILRDSQGEDHPDNAGTFVLHQIVKP